MPELMKQISFGKLDEGMEMPHLLDIQTRAFEALLQLDAASHNREDVGLERVFKDLFPITDVHENFSLEFVRYSLGEPKYSVEECIERDMTYSAPLKATLQLVINEEVNGVKRPRNIIEKEVYLGELPLLTGLGTFVINGAHHPVPRVVGRVHRRHPRRHLRPHRQEEEVPGHRTPARVRVWGEPRHSAALLRRPRPRPHAQARRPSRDARGDRGHHRRGHHARW
jgi:DNA-directed RNA polymerase beta subunit